MSKFIQCMTVAALVLLSTLTPERASAQQSPFGAGWYFVSICGLTEPAASQYCWFGQAAYLGPYTSVEQCESTLTLLINTNSIMVTWPYAPSNCFYMN